MNYLTEERGRLWISERAWHLRLVRAILEEDFSPRDLCSYFWIVVGSVFIGALALLPLAAQYLVDKFTRRPNRLLKAIVVGLVILLLAVSSIAIAAAVTFLAFLFFTNLGVVWTWLIQSWHWAKIILAVFGVAGGLFAFAAIVAGAYALGEKLDERQPKRPRKQHEPNLVSEWIRAKKHRICPLIEVRRKAG